ncbi:MAG: UDP-2,3-diacylglucosamine diphosphatase [candidate division KSB1 bacterium]|nr:UDP-2,3-diacylglucosamine diphosphatase [candidate division KSB1 bacterium]MDZ7412864.1 UDP-2,3-diacylglucosamine diphosphatase [candidate division KSB1 bacterium]
MTTAAHALFIADAHLRGTAEAAEQEKVRRLHSFLTQAAPYVAVLCICGDLFDFWFEYRHAVVNRYFRTLRLLADLVDNGTEVHYVAGNHDFWMRDFLAQEVGLVVHRHTFQGHVAGQRVFVRHGDGIDVGDRGYRLLKRVLQHPVGVAMYRLVHPDLGVPVAEFFSTLSRNHGAQREFRGRQHYRAYAAHTIARGHDVVVLAHTHEPTCEPIANGVYLNPGDWITHFTFGLVDQNGVWLKEWMGDQGAREIAHLPLPSTQR